MRKKILSIVALLLVAVSGAWADATIAKLWVGNSEEVTSEGTITGTGATEGTASVAIENGSMVLTLNNFKFIGCGHNDSGIYYQSNANGDTPLIIKIEGNNEITLPGADKSLYGFFLYGGNGDHVFTITGSGSLTVTVGDGNLSNGIFVQQADLVLAGGTVTANVGSAEAEFKSLGVSVPQGTLTIDGCTLKASGSTTSESRGINVKKNVTIKSGELEAYGYSKGIMNSDGGDALAFAVGVTPTLFKAGDNEASATDVSKYEGQKYLHVVCTGGDEPAAPTGDGVNYQLTKATDAEAHGTITFKVGENAVTAAQEGQTVTMTITPAEGWAVGTVTGKWYAAIAATRSSIDLLKDFELTPVEGQTNQWTFTMERANAEISVTYTKIIQTSWVQDISAVTYNGTAQKPTVTVKDGETELVENTDYTVSYSNNVNAGTATATITGKGSYSGTVNKNFTINRAKGKVLFSPYKFTKTYGDPDFTIRPSVTGDGTLSYKSDKETVATVNSTTGKVSIKGIGTVRITAKLSNSTNYIGAEDWYEVTINPKKATVTIGPNGMATYCGAEPLDFTGNKNLEAYTVIGCSYNTNTIWMSRVYKVPAETPIVIKGAEGSYTLDCTTSSASYYKNKLVGNTSGSTIQVNETDGTLRNYYLKDGTFKRVKNYANIATGKSYLQLPNTPAAEKAGSAQSIQLSSTGKSTLCSNVDLDFSGFEDGLKAYVVTGYDMPTKTFWLNRVIEASAGTPLYLAGKANTSYSIPSKGVQTAFENMLVGNTSGSTIQVNETEEDASGELLRNLYLKDGTFKLVKGYVNIANGKCYLQAPSTVVAAMARGIEDPDFTFILNDEMMSIGFSDFDDDSETTGIMSVEKDNTSDVIYDLQGRRVIAPKKGIYIKNGRKVVMK